MMAAHQHPHHLSGAAVHGRLPRHVYVFHDSENAHFRDASVTGSQIFECTLRAALACVAPDPQVVEHMSLAELTISWILPVCPAKTTAAPYMPSPRAMQDLQDRGVIFPNPGFKADAVDVFLTEKINAFVAEKVRLPPEYKADFLVVLISGDRDFHGSIRQIQHAGLRLVLIHPNNMRAAVTDQVPARCNLPYWVNIIHGQWRFSSQQPFQPALPLQPSFHAQPALPTMSFDTHQLHPDSTARARAAVACLARVDVSASPCIMLTIKVVHVVPQPTVTVRMTADNWATMSDHACVLAGSSEPGINLFVLSIVVPALPADLPSSGLCNIEFCIRTQVPGRPEVWDKPGHDRNFIIARHPAVAVATTPYSTPSPSSYPYHQHHQHHHPAAGHAQPQPQCPQPARYGPTATATAEATIKLSAPHVNYLKRFPHPLLEQLTRRLGGVCPGAQLSVREANNKLLVAGIPAAKRNECESAMQRAANAFKTECLHMETVELAGLDRHAVFATKALVALTSNRIAFTIYDAASSAPGSDAAGSAPRSGVHFVWAAEEEDARRPVVAAAVSALEAHTTVIRTLPVDGRFLQLVDQSLRQLRGQVAQVAGQVTLKVVKGSHMTPPSPFGAVEVTGPPKAADAAAKHINNSFIRRLESTVVHLTRASGLKKDYFVKNMERLRDQADDAAGGNTSDTASSDGDSDDEGDADANDTVGAAGDRAGSRGKCRRSTAVAVVPVFRADCADIYINYCREDQAAAAELKRRLEEIDASFRVKYAPAGSLSDIDLRTLLSDVPDVRFKKQAHEKHGLQVLVNGPAEAVDEAVSLIKTKVGGGAVDEVRVIAAATPLLARALKLVGNRALLDELCERVPQSMVARGLPPGQVKVLFKSAAKAGVLQIKAGKRHIDALAKAAKQALHDAGARLQVLQLPLSPAECDHLFFSATNMLHLAGAKGVLVARASDAEAVSTHNGHVELVRAALPSGLQLRVLQAPYQECGAEAVVNAANSQLRHSGGLAKAIAQAAGPAFAAESQRLADTGGVPTGSARSTGAGDLQAQHGLRLVIHAVAPRFCLGQDSKQLPLLRSCLVAALDEADAAGVSSLVVPAVGSGYYGWNATVVAELAVAAIQGWAASHPLSTLQTIYLADTDADKAQAFAKAVRDGVAPGGGAGPAAPAPFSPPSRRARTLPPPPMPALPEHVWFWHKPEVGKWVPYDYDQVVQLELALARKESECEVMGDTNGVKSDSKFMPPGAAAPVYAINFGAMLQRNVASGNIRAVRRRLRNPDEKPPCYDKAYEIWQRQMAHHRTVAAQAAPAAGAVAAAPASSLRLLPMGKGEGAGSAVAAGGGVSNPASNTIGGGVVLCGPAAEVADLACSIPRALKAARSKQALEHKTGSAAAAQALLAASEVQAAMAKHAVTAETAADGTITLCFLGHGGFEAVDKAICTVLLRDLTAKAQVQYPATWTNAEGSGPFVPGSGAAAAAVDVPSGSAEFQEIVRFFGSDGFGKTVVSVKRIQNEGLWGRYVALRNAIANERGAEAVNERRMFHGSRGTPPEKIWANTGFDFRYSKKGMFGSGAYFAFSMHYSDSYRYNVPEGVPEGVPGTAGRRLGQAFVALVTAGVEETCAPDSSKVHPKPGCDSVVGPVSATHNATIVYEVAQSYPEYLVTYQCC